MPGEEKRKKSESGIVPETYKNLLHLWQNRKFVLNLNNLIFFLLACLIDDQYASHFNKRLLIED